MTVLITGAPGSLAAIQFSLLSIGPVLDDLSTGNRAAVPSGCCFFAGDVGDTELVLRLVQHHRIDAILHFAAKIVVPESVADPLNYYLNNKSKHMLCSISKSMSIRRTASLAIGASPCFT